MIDANRDEICLFKKQFCADETARRNMVRNFEIEIESVEETLPWKNIVSYAADERIIKREFTIFKVMDHKIEKVYYPVFSMEKARKIADEMQMELPVSKTIFWNIDQHVGKESENDICGRGRTGYDNMQLRRLILCTRSMMLLHIEKPKPMKNAMKEIYEKMELHPGWRVRGSEVKSINTAIRSYLHNDLNLSNERFKNIQDYLKYLRRKSLPCSIKKMDFTGLRKILHEEYEEEQIFF